MTAGMRELLADAARLSEQGGRICPWNYSSHAVGRCKKLGLIAPVVVVLGSDEGKVRQATEYTITEEGRSALKNFGGT